MIEVEIPKDIRKYEAKLVGPFTTRQTIFLVISVAISLFIYKSLPFLGQDIRFFIILIFISPFVLCGWVKPYGMHFESFVKSAFISTVLAPKERKYKTKNSYAEINQNIINEIENRDAEKNNKKKGSKSKAAKKRKAHHFSLLKIIFLLIFVLIIFSIMLYFAQNHFGFTIIDFTPLINIAKTVILKGEMLINGQ